MLEHLLARNKIICSDDNEPLELLIQREVVDNPSVRRQISIWPQTKTQLLAAEPAGLSTLAQAHPLCSAYSKYVVAQPYYYLASSSSCPPILLHI